MAIVASRVGQSVERVEDNALLTGRARFLDDMPVRADTVHAAVVRSSHAHAEVLAIDVSAALAHPGVVGVLTGADAIRWSKPFVVGVKQPMEHWCLAVDKVRYVGEPVAVVLAEDRYIAEDAAELVLVTYKPLAAVLDLCAAIAPGAPILHHKVGSNVVSERHFSYGDVESAFAIADHIVDLSVRYPRNSCTPIEAMAVVAEYQSQDGSYDVLSNFQGPFALHPVMALALQIPGGKLRMRSPAFSGGSFGVKQSVFPYVVAMALASRKVGRPVKWVEDRLEHLEAATSASGRMSKISAAVRADGVVLALDLEQHDDCGGYLRAPEPASLYRMHGNLSGAYGVKNIRVVNRVVMTNKTPSGLNRGFGGPQLYFAIERLMQKISKHLKIDHLDIIRRNLVPAGAFPYRTPSGGLLDSGDYPEAVRRAIEDGGYSGLIDRRDKARAEGRLYGIGLTAVVEPSVSNMGYITTALTAAERAKAGPKNGAHATATVALDPLGTVLVNTASVPQGQGQATVLQQVVADVFGLPTTAVVVNLEFDTQKDPWSIAAGNYSSRFAAAVAGAALEAASRLKDQLIEIAAHIFNVDKSQIVFADGIVCAANKQNTELPFSRLAALSHWSPGTLPKGVRPALRETVFWSMPQHTAPDEADRINSSGVYGFIFDYCGVEIDRTTGRLTIDKYVTMHDAGRILHPAMVDGQIQGAFANAVGATLYEEFQYAPDGGFLSGTFADYMVPTACEVPDTLILHMETPSPFTPLGSKGVGEGNCMSTPVCLANAVADALGTEDINLPLTPCRLLSLVGDDEPEPAEKKMSHKDAAMAGDLTGEGDLKVPLGRSDLWHALLDPTILATVIPGCHQLHQVGVHDYQAEVTLGVGPVRGRFNVSITLSDLKEPHTLVLTGRAEGPLGISKGRGQVFLEDLPNGTRLRYCYGVDVSGKLAAVGGRMLDGAAKILIRQFFQRLITTIGAKAEKGSVFTRVLDRLRRLG